jgi:hypothetical protein
LLNFSIGGPTSMAPTDYSKYRDPGLVPPTPPSPAQQTAERPLSPPPGAEPGGLIDRIAIANAEQQQRQAPDLEKMMMVMAKALEMQGSRLRRWPHWSCMTTTRRRCASSY